VIYKLIHETKNNLIDALVEYFVEGDWEGIPVLDHWPFEYRKCPAVILEASPGSVIRTGVGDLLKADKDSGKMVYGGKYSIEFTITIQAEDTIEKEKLTDAVVLFCTYLGRDALLAKNIIPTPDSPRIAGESQEEEGGHMIFRTQVNFVCQTEWYEAVSVETMESYGITITVDGD